MVTTLTALSICSHCLSCIWCKWLICTIYPSVNLSVVFWSFSNFVQYILLCRLYNNNLHLCLGGKVLLGVIFTFCWCHQYFVLLLQLLHLTTLSPAGHAGEKGSSYLALCCVPISAIYVTITHLSSQFGTSCALGVIVNSFATPQSP